MTTQNKKTSNCAGTQWDAFAHYPISLYLYFGIFISGTPNPRWFVDGYYTATVMPNLLFPPSFTGFIMVMTIFRCYAVIGFIALMNYFGAFLAQIWAQPAQGIEEWLRKGLGTHP